MMEATEQAPLAPPVNPLVDEIDRAHASLSPAAQQAIEQAHGMLGIQPPKSAAALTESAQPYSVNNGTYPVQQTDKSAGYAPSPSESNASESVRSGVDPTGQIARVAPAKMEVSAPSESSGGIAPAGVSIPGTMSNSMAPMKPTASQEKLSHIQNTGNGISQIKNPWGRVPLQILDAIGSGLFPRIAQGIPGTEAHHELALNQATGAVKQEEEQRAAADKSAQEQALTAHTNAEVPLAEAQTHETNVRADTLIPAQGAEAAARAELAKHPSDEFTQFPTAQGMMKISKRTGDISPVQVNGETVQPIEKITPVHVEKLDNGDVVGVHEDPSTHKLTSTVLYHGDPKLETELAKLEINGKSHSVVVNKKTGETIKDLGETGEKPATVNVNAGLSALDRESTHFAKSHEKSVSDANTQLEKIADARSMINGSAEAQALGVPKVMTALVSGAGSGVRITQAELNAIAKARGISGDVEGFLNSVSGKGKLTSTQQKQLTGMLDDVKARIVQKQAIANEALDKINSAQSRDQIIQYDKEARQKVTDLEKSESAASGAPAKLASKADYDKLPKGAKYIDSDGKTYTKK